MAEGARLESVYTFIAYRGFESLSLRQILKGPVLRGFLVFDCVVKNSNTGVPQSGTGFDIFAGSEFQMRLRLRSEPEGQSTGVYFVILISPPNLIPRLRVFM